MLGARLPGITVALFVILALAPGSALAAGGGQCNGIVDPYAQVVEADSPLLYNPLDESSGPIMCDYSGNLNSGSYSASGVTYGVAGPLAGDPTQTAVSAAGTIPSGAPIGTLGSLPQLSGDQSFTLEGWFKGSSSPNEVLVTLNGNSTFGLAIWSGHSDCNTGIDVYLALDEHGADNCWDAQTLAGINIRDGNWHYLAVTYDASSGEVSGYVDGQDLGAETISGAPFWSDPEVLLGGWTDTSVNQPFVGAMAQAAVYGTALSADTIDDHYDAAAVTPSITAPAHFTDADVAPIQTTSHGTYSWTVGGAAGDPLRFYPTTSAPQPVASFTGKATSTIADPELEIAPSLTLRLDDQDDELTGATVTTPDPYSQDTLGFTAQAGITGSYSQAGGTGTLTLSGVASVEDYANALDSVFYYYAWSTAAPGVYVDAFSGDQTRPVSWQVSDGTTVSATATTQLDIVMPNLLTTDTGPISGGTAPCDVPPDTLIAMPHECQPSSLTVGGSAQQVAFDDLQSLGQIVDPGPIVISVDPATTNNACSVSQTQQLTDGIATIKALATGTCVIDEAQDSATGVSDASPTTEFAPALDQLEFPVLPGSQSVVFDSTSPGKANAGSSYTVSAHSSAGGAVSFAIDAASSAGTCTLGGAAGDVVSFSAPGNCLIDARAAANASYTAGQAQQTVTVSGISSHGIGPIRSTGTSVGFSLPCAGSATASCTGTVSLVSGEQLSGGKPVGVIASGAHRRRTVSVTLGSEHYRIAGGHHKTVTIKLNALARRLLRTFHKLPTKLDDKPTGAGRATVLKTLTIKPVPRKRKKK